MRFIMIDETMITVVLGITAIGVPVISTIGLFFTKQILEMRKEIAKLCERMAREETKSAIYHHK